MTRSSTHRIACLQQAQVRRPDDKRIRRALAEAKRIEKKGSHR